MKKRSKILISLLVIISIICLARLIIGKAFSTSIAVTLILLAIAIIAITAKICITIVATYKSYISNKDNK